MRSACFHLKTHIRDGEQGCRGRPRPVGRVVLLFHDLVDFHNHFAFGAVGERDRLDVRIDHRPLTCPVAAHFVASVDMTAFHAVCPNDILVHGCEHRLHVTSVEAVVNTFKEVHFVRHSNLATSWPTLAQTPFFYTPLKI